jgi:DNA-binding Lrp family transcriptional regulator
LAEWLGSSAMSTTRLEPLLSHPRPRDLLVLDEPPLGPGEEERTRPEEPLDFSILREFTGEQSPAVGIDPRSSPESIAKRLHLSPATVRRRLTAWRTRGFLRGFDVIPHPSLLGGRLVARVLDFENSVAQERGVGPLSWIDGMIQIDVGQTKLVAVFFVANNSQSERRLRQLESVGGVREVGAERVFELPACARRMSRVDWRLVAAIRGDPESGLGTLAERVGLSTRATSRRYHALLDAGALIFDPIFDFSRFDQTVALLLATVRPPDLTPETERKVREIHPRSIRILAPTVEVTRSTCGQVSLWVTAPTTAELDHLAARVAHLPGVSDVVLWYERRILPVRSWLDERLESLVKSGEHAPSPGAH